MVRVRQKKIFYISFLPTFSINFNSCYFFSSSRNIKKYQNLQKSKSIRGKIFLIYFLFSGM
ncbi:hypothetical protein RhiirC2_564258 [Rhizophagus irregularis]|uniref:Uncharacterized protein n=1 Tax=Rhizophagus irregularis TaxID=588596 RepID=A0A2N1N1I3_9GLOM|nr:hypothetical protein RhiirC2_564258 [Rhizophagus irregularis]